MASGTITFTAKTSSSNTKLQGKLEWSSVSNGSVANTSTVTTKLYVRRADSLSGATSGKGWGGTVQVGNNTAHSFSSLSSELSVSTTYKLLKTYTDTVTHNDDGTCSVLISGSVKGCTGTSLAGLTSSGSATVTLDTIPRASAMTITDANGNDVVSCNIGDTIRMNIDRKADTFTHNIYYSIDPSGIGMTMLVADYTGLTYDWVLPRDVVQYLTTDPGYIYITLATYDSEGTFIGQTDPIDICVIVPEDIVPTASIGDLSDVGGIVPTDWNIFVQGKSKLSFNISGEGAEGSTITNYTVEVNGETFNKTETSTIITSALTTSGTNTISLTVTDSRNRSTTVTKDFEVVPYSSPVLDTYSAERSDSSGTLVDDGEYLSYIINGTIADCSGKNTATYSIGYTVDGSLVWVVVNTTETSTVLPGQTFAGGKSHNIYFKMVDSLGSTVIVETTLESVFKLVNINKSITAMALGKKSRAGIDEKLLEVALPLEFVDDAHTSMRSYLLDMIYPIGSIYISVNPMNPEDLFGGSWDSFGTGRTLVGVDVEQDEFATVEQEGGHKDLQAHSHTGTTNSDGAHKHATQGRVNSGSTTPSIFESLAGAGSTRTVNVPRSGTNGAHSHAFTTDEAGTGDSGNLQPYITVYMWKRTA